MKGIKKTCRTEEKAKGEVKPINNFINKKL
jgi:hypothetical protein